MSTVADESVGEYFNHDDQHINTMVLRTFDDDGSSSWTLRYYSGSELYDHALFITSNGTNQLNDIPEHWRFPAGRLISIFDRITSPIVDEQRFFCDLITTYRLMFGINLYLVVDDVNNCFVIDPAEYSGTNLENNDFDKYAFMYIIKNEWKYNSIFTNNSDGKSQTIFSKSQMVHQLGLEDLLNNQMFHGKSNPVKINSEVTSSLQEQTQNDTISTTIPIVENNDMNVDVSSQDTVVQPQCPRMTVDKKISEILDDMKRLLANYVISPTDEIITIPLVFNVTNFEELSQEDRNAMVNNYMTIIGAYCRGLTNTVNYSESEVMDTSNGNLQGDSHEQNGNHHPSDDVGERTDLNPLTVSNVTPSIGHQEEEEQTFEAPIIDIHPKKKLKDRNFKDLVPKLVKSKANMKGKKKTKIGLLQGSGKQRTMPSVRIDDRAADAKYLACQAQTIDERPNIYKLIVPKGTTANQKLITHENTLNCLNFSTCNKNDYFDQNNRILYLKINPEDRQAGVKEIQVFLLTLYQNSTTDKETINEGNLDVCKLAFWFCKNIGTHHPKASVSWTNEITSIKKASVKKQEKQ